MVVPTRRRETADDVLRAHVAAPRDMQRAPRQPHVHRGHLTERGGHELRRGHRRVRQHAAVGEQPPDARTEADIEHPDDQPQPGVELLGLQGGVDVAHIVLLDQRQRVRCGDAGLLERLDVEPVGLDHLHRQPGDLGTMVAPAAGQDHRHLDPVSPDQLLDQPVCQRVVTAHDQVTPLRLLVHRPPGQPDPRDGPLRPGSGTEAGRYPGLGGHARMVSAPGDNPARRMGVRLRAAGPERKLRARCVAQDVSARRWVAARSP